jgi:hypothetical protein
MPGQFQATILRAESDPALARDLLQKPITTLAKLGVNIPGVTDEEAAKSLAIAAPDLHAVLSAAASGKPLPPRQGFPGSCFMCTGMIAFMAATVVAALGIGAGVIATAESPFIPPLVAIFGELGLTVSAAEVVVWVNNAYGAATNAAAFARVLCTMATLCP